MWRKLTPNSKQSWKDSEKDGTAASKPAKKGRPRKGTGTKAVHDLIASAEVQGVAASTTPGAGGEAAAGGPAAADAAAGVTFDDEL